MDRNKIEPREGWPATIEEQGLVYWRTALPDGGEISYWNEEAFYTLTEAEAYEYEAVTRVLLGMLVEAGDFIIENNLFARMGIPGWAVPLIKETWESEPPMLYGRFDFALDPEGKLKLLEFNADTPTAALEAGVIQWQWAKDQFGDQVDQWNRLHEALIERWGELSAAGRIADKVHFFHTSAENSGEDFMTVAYLAETARQAGLECELAPIEKLGYVDGVGFVNGADDERVQTAFKLYPWEWLVHERDWEELRKTHNAGNAPVKGKTTWIEPIWKMLWSNKGILPILWELNPGHENLLPAFFTAPPYEPDGSGALTRAKAEGGAGAAIAEALDRIQTIPGPVDSVGNRLTTRGTVGDSYVVKPLLSREGADSVIVIDGVLADAGPEQGYGEEGYVIQQYADLGTYDGQHPVLGVWVVDMEPQGLGIRESESLVTNNLSRFVPHTIAG